MQESCAQYLHRFSGFTLWMLVEQPNDFQQVIDQMNPATTPWQAHATILYGMNLTEAAARSHFERLRTELKGTPPLHLQCGTPPIIWDDYPPFNMASAGIDLSVDSESLAKLQLAATTSYDMQPGSGSIGPPHVSFIYDNIGSSHVTPTTIEDIRHRWPSLAPGSPVTIDAIALVDMRDATVGEWKVLDRIELGGTK
jgi:hypothetical protein